MPYAPLEYIQGDGASYINTSLNLQGSKYFTIKVANDVSVNYSKIFGISNTYVLQQTGTSLTSYALRYQVTGQSDIFNLDLRNAMELKVTSAGILSNVNTQTVYVNRNTINQTASIHLFHMEGLNEYSKCKIYYFKLYNSNDRQKLFFGIQW